MDREEDLSSENDCVYSESSGRGVRKGFCLESLRRKNTCMLSFGEAWNLGGRKARLKGGGERWKGGVVSARIKRPEATNSSWSESGLMRTGGIIGLSVYHEVGRGKYFH